MNDSTNKRIDNIIKDTQDLKTSLEFTQADMAELKQLNCQKKIEEIQASLESLAEKLDDLENRSRRNNLCFDGLHEDEDTSTETWQQSEDKVNRIISEQLGLNAENILIERAHRVGKKKETGKPRTIVAKFLSFKDREKILKSRKQLKGTRITVREDFSDRVAEKREEN